MNDQNKNRVFELIEEIKLAINEFDSLPFLVKHSPEGKKAAERLGRWRKTLMTVLDNE